ncbi:hypothetical protein D3C78_1258270 [compost metagenome]
MQHAHAGQITQAAGLQGHGIRPRNRGLRCNHRRRGRQHDQGYQQRGRGQQKKGIAGGRSIPQQQGTLAEVIDHQAGKHQPEPAQPYSAAAHMPHVGIQGLGPGHGQENGR